MRVLNHRPTRIRVVQAALAVSNQEEVLRELMRTEEPTEEATALLEDLRQKVARSLADRKLSSRCD